MQAEAYDVKDFITWRVLLGVVIFIVGMVAITYTYYVFGIMGFLIGVALIGVPPSHTRVERRL